ncbi:MAG: general secretion pathway protein GspK [Planctomycetaceae bacterium]|nr:general secretion pathway protein GspK [Planctomycetaceae bacterium]
MRIIKKSPHGTVLVLILVVSVLLTLAVFTFSQLMLSERKGASYGMRQKQTRMLAESGVEWLRLFLSQDQLTIEERGDLYDNPSFCGVWVTDGNPDGFNARFRPDPRDVGRFTILAPRLSDDGSLIGEGVRYGLEDESAKVNLHWVMQIDKEYPGMGRIILTRLPGIDDMLADTLLDYMDEDDDPREFGAERDYYELLEPPYTPKNAVPDSIDELLLVDGITPQLLYGIDWNRNGMLDLGEPDPITLEEAFGVTDESLNLGLAAYLTVDSRESMLTPDGLSLKINVNSEDLQTLHGQLLEVFEDERWADYIVAYRQYGPQNSQADAATSIEIEQNQTEQERNSTSATTQAGSISFSQEATTKIKSLLDFVGGSTQIRYEGGTGAQTLQSPFSPEIAQMQSYLPMLYDYLTLTAEPMVGRINLNQSPRAVLQMLSTRFDDSEAALESLYAAMGIDPAMLEAATSAASGGGSADENSDSSSSDSGLPQAGSILEMLGIPTEEVDPLIEGILEMRIPDPAQAAEYSPDMLYPYWPYTQGITDNLETIKKIEPYFCTRGSVYKTQIVGRFDAKSPAVRFEVWYDASVRPAKIIRIRELTELGPGYPPEMLGIDETGIGNRE